MPFCGPRNFNTSAGLRDSSSLTLASLRADVAATLAFTSAGAAQTTAGIAVAIKIATINVRIAASIKKPAKAYREVARGASALRNRSPDISTNVPSWAAVTWPPFEAFPGHLGD